MIEDPRKGIQRVVYWASARFGIEARLVEDASVFALDDRITLPNRESDRNG